MDSRNASQPWLEVLYIALTFLGINANLEDLGREAPSQPSLLWLQSTLSQRSDAHAQIFPTTLSQIQRRLNATQELLMVELSGSPYFITECERETVTLRDPNTTLTLRQSAFRAAWSGSLLSISTDPILAESEIASWKPTHVAIAISTCLLAMTLAVLIRHAIKRG